MSTFGYMSSIGHPRDIILENRKPLSCLEKQDIKQREWNPPRKWLQKSTKNSSFFPKLILSPQFMGENNETKRKMYHDSYHFQKEVEKECKSNEFESVSVKDMSQTQSEISVRDSTSSCASTYWENSETPDCEDIIHMDTLYETNSEYSDRKKTKEEEDTREKQTSQCAFKIDEKDFSENCKVKEIGTHIAVKFENSAFSKYKQDKFRGNSLTFLNRTLRESASGRELENLKGKKRGEELKVKQVEFIPPKPPKRINFEHLDVFCDNTMRIVPNGSCKRRRYQSVSIIKQKFQSLYPLYDDSKDIVPLIRISSASAGKKPFPSDSRAVATKKEMSSWQVGIQYTEKKKPKNKSSTYLLYPEENDDLDTTGDDTDSGQSTPSHLSCDNHQNKGVNGGKISFQSSPKSVFSRFSEPAFPVSEKNNTLQHYKERRRNSGGMVSPTRSCISHMPTVAEGKEIKKGGKHAGRFKVRFSEPPSSMNELRSGDALKTSKIVMRGKGDWRKKLPTKLTIGLSVIP